MKLLLLALLLALGSCLYRGSLLKKKITLLDLAAKQDIGIDNSGHLFKGPKRLTCDDVRHMESSVPLANACKARGGDWYFS